MHEAYVRKCRHVNVLLDDLSLAISHRHVIASHHDDAQMVASLAALHAEFKDTWTYIKSTFDATKQVVEDPAALLHLHSEDLNTTLVQVRKACLQLHRTIASHDESFMALDLFRVNQARLQFSKWSVPAAHDDGALHKAHLRVEGQLRKTMGAAGFQSLTGGMAVPPSRSFTEWHGSVVAMLASVAAYEALLEIDASSPSTSGNNTKDTLNIENIGSTQGTLCEAAAVLPSQLQSTSAGDSRVLPKQARRTKMSLDISELRQCWIDGVKLREADLAAAAQAEKDAIHMRAVERQAIQSAQEKFRNDQHKRKLTIWEAVIEGWPVEKINQLAVAEGKKAAQDGAGAFRLRDSQAENGRTLLQLACWSGHVHLVRYFVDKGSNLGQFDCVNNRFSLLHDAARAGRADVVRVLLEYGLPCNILDNYGDNPVHWAARRNHVDTVQALLDLPLKDVATASPTVISTAQITRWRSVLATNGRGKRPAHLTTLHRLRTILMDFELVAQAGLEQYNRQGASEAAMLKRRDGLGPPPVKRIPLTSGGGNSGGSSRGMVPQRCHVDVADSASPPSSSSPSTSGVRTTDPPVVDGRRQREFRVKQATARAVKNFEKEGRKHANVQLAGRVFRHSLQPTSSAFAIKTDDMDIFLDHVVE
ncbi:hypothetical protein, variant [Aphanomyces astaci]|uniref:Uncharacterized protein n=1 Tax=Aphanomyces astaci TaxID=112090 RepID=W4G1H7_APHAT|nr:hypothetical protein, variant [Aphanomyces astaci]ETV72788.1 hypothetical protein, variant [Aphanomyces astaci]|eukprot:XP_009837574.1 hypothetical protein, variant [Aphanomyces astaci]